MAVIDDRGQHTYQELAAMIAGMGLYLSTQTQGTKVGIFLPASTAFVVSFYGTLAAGKTAVPINFLLGEKEIAHVIKDSGIEVILSAPPLAERLKDLPIQVIDLMTLPPPPAGILEMVAPHMPTAASDDLAVIMYTSGTSAMPKGVLLTHGNLVADVMSAIQHARLTEKHKFLGILPLFHSTGMLATLLAPMILGSTVVYIARFSPVGTIHAIRDHQISIVVAVPSMYGAMARLKSSGPDDVKSLYAALSGGEPLPQAVREAFQQKFGMMICEGYGLTETIGPIAFNVPFAIRPGSVGRLIPNAEVKLVDDEGKPVPPGQSGEVWMRGPMIMKGYNNLPKESAEALTPGRVLQERRPWHARSRRLPAHHRAEEGLDHYCRRKGGAA